MALGKAVFSLMANFPDLFWVPLQNQTVKKKKHNYKVAVTSDLKYQHQSKGAKMDSSESYMGTTRKVTTVKVLARKVLNTMLQNSQPQALGERKHSSAQTNKVRLVKHLRENPKNIWQLSNFSLY